MIFIRIFGLFLIGILLIIGLIDGFIREFFSPSPEFDSEKFADDLIEMALRDK